MRGGLDNFHPRLLREMAKQTAGLAIYCSNRYETSVTGEKQIKYHGGNRRSFYLTQDSKPLVVQSGLVCRVIWVATKEKELLCLKNVCLCHSKPKGFLITGTSSAWGSELIRVEKTILLSGKQNMQLSFAKNSPCQTILIFCLKTNPQVQ